MPNFEYTPDVKILDLSSEFYDRVEPANFPKMTLRFRNQEAAQSVGLASLSDEDWVNHLGRFKPLPQNLQQPLALRYHGHQFMSYNPQLGDGRGFLFAQIKNEYGKLLDLGTKGSGQTPYSRRGDGRLTLKGAVREALATEMLHTFGMRTSLTFSIIETGEQLTRYDEPSPTRSAVLVRLSHSHWRIGTLQRLAALGDSKSMIEFINFFCAHYEVQGFNPDQVQDDKVFSFFRSVTLKNAQLTAQWMMAGFVHGVLNTDNISLTGESFDYGPYRFLPTYDPNFVAAYFDETGLYAYGKQPQIMVWNLSQLALSLGLITEEHRLKEILAHEFEKEFAHQILKVFIRRLGLCPLSPEEDEELLRLFFQFLQQTQCFFEQTFYDLYGGLNKERLKYSQQSEKYFHETFSPLASHLEKYSSLNPTLENVEYFRTGRCEGLLIDEIEEIWKAIDESDNWKPFYQKIERLKGLRSLLQN